MKRFLSFLTTSLLALTAAGQEGPWSGELDIQGSKLSLVFHFDADGCTMDSPSQGAKGIKAEKSITPQGKVRVDISALNAYFEGVMLVKKIFGTFNQNGVSLPLTLKPGAPKPNRPQTPRAPFPYTEEQVEFSNDGFTFHGTLTLPEGYSHETPVLVMVTGSGQQNRDEELMDHRPFAVIADALARKGIATMRFDDRGWGDKDFRFYNYNVGRHKTDAAAGIALMRKRFKHVGVMGHSEGGTIGLMLAAEGQVDCCVSLAGMAVSGKETLLAQNRTMLSAYGLPADVVEGYCHSLGKAFDAVIDGRTTDSIDRSLVPEALKPNFEATLQQLSAPYMRDLLTTDVRGLLPKVTCPVLALNGSLDTQVAAAANLEAIDAGLTGSRHETLALEGLNHLFQHCQTGLVDEYQRIEETFAPEALEKICMWVKALF